MTPNNGQAQGEKAPMGRLQFAVLRRIHPKYREQHRLEELVGPTNCWDELVQYQFNIFRGVGLKPEHAVLDIGCGPLTAGMKLIPYLNRGKYVGVDLRVEPLREGYRLIAKHSFVEKNPTLINSATFGSEELGERLFDFIWMSQLSYHFDDGLMTKLFEEAQRRLKTGGFLVFDIIDPERKLSATAHWSGFRFHSRPIDFFAELGRKFGFDMENRGRIFEFGYPKRFGLHTNILLRFRKG